MDIFVRFAVGNQSVVEDEFDFQAWCFSSRGCGGRKSSSRHRSRGRHGTGVKVGAAVGGGVNVGVGTLRISADSSENYTKSWVSSWAIAAVVDHN